MNPETTELRKFRVESVDLASLGRTWEIEYDPKTGYVHMLREETDPEVDLDPSNPNDFADALTDIRRWEPSASMAGLWHNAK